MYDVPEQWREKMRERERRRSALLLFMAVAVFIAAMFVLGP